MQFYHYETRVENWQVQEPVLGLSYSNFELKMKISKISLNSKIWLELAEVWSLDPPVLNPIRDKRCKKTTQDKPACTSENLSCLVLLITGYFEDRRPASNMDPYVVTSMIAETTILWKPWEAHGRWEHKLYVYGHYLSCWLWSHSWSLSICCGILVFIAVHCRSYCWIYF